MYSQAFPLAQATGVSGHQAPCGVGEQTKPAAQDAPLENPRPRLHILDEDTEVDTFVGSSAAFKFIQRPRSVPAKTETPKIANKSMQRDTRSIMPATGRRLCSMHSTVKRSEDWRDKHWSGRMIRTSWMYPVFWPPGINCSQPRTTFVNSKIPQPSRKYEFLLTISPYDTTLHSISKEIII